MPSFTDVGKWNTVHRIVFMVTRVSTELMSCKIRKSIRTQWIVERNRIVYCRQNVLRASLKFSTLTCERGTPL